MPSAQLGVLAALPFRLFIAAYNSLSKSLVGTKSLIQKYWAPPPATVVGVASTYNPYRDEIGSGGKQTASGSLMTQLHGLRRFGSICGSSLVVSAMAKIIDRPLRWSRAAKSVSSSKSTMLVHLDLAALSTSTNGVCATSIRLNGSVSSAMSKLHFCAMTTGRRDRLPAKTIPSHNSCHPRHCLGQCLPPSRNCN